MQLISTDASAVSTAAPNSNLCVNMSSIIWPATRETWTWSLWSFKSSIDILSPNLMFSRNFCYYWGRRISISGWAVLRAECRMGNLYLSEYWAYPLRTYTCEVTLWYMRLLHVLNWKAKPGCSNHHKISTPTYNRHDPSLSHAGILTNKLSHLAHLKKEREAVSNYDNCVVFQWCQLITGR